MPLFGFLITITAVVFIALAFVRPTFLSEFTNKVAEWFAYLRASPLMWLEAVGRLLFGVGILAILFLLYLVVLGASAQADPFDSSAYSPYAVSRVASSGVKAQRGRDPFPGVVRQAAGGHVVLSSFYGGGERLNRHTASGAVFRPNGLTAAHRSLPLGTKVQLSLNGRTVVATINDRGPAAYTGRSLDVSKGVAASLGFVRAGTAHLTMVVLR